MQVPSRGRVGAMHQVLNEIAIGMANLIQEAEANARLKDYECAQFRKMTHKRQGFQTNGQEI